MALVALAGRRDHRAMGVLVAAGAILEGAVLDLEALGVLGMALNAVVPEVVAFQRKGGLVVIEPGRPEVLDLSIVERMADRAVGQLRIAELMRVLEALGAGRHPFAVAGRALAPQAE